MKEKNTEKKTYEEPTLVKHGKLADITEGRILVVGSSVVEVGDGDTT